MLHSKTPDIYKMQIQGISLKPPVLEYKSEVPRGLNYKGKMLTWYVHGHVLANGQLKDGAL